MHVTGTRLFSKCFDPDGSEGLTFIDLTQQLKTPQQIFLFSWCQAGIDFYPADCDKMTVPREQQRMELFPNIDTLRTPFSAENAALLAQAHLCSD